MVEVPDVWRIVKICDKEQTVFKIFAGWHGSYLGSNSWRVNSGIKAIKWEEKKECWKVIGYSGTEYMLYPNLEKWAVPNYEIYNSWKTQFPENVFESSIEEAIEWCSK